MLKILDVQHSFASQDSYDSRTRIQSFHKKYSKLDTVRPRDTWPQAARTLRIDISE